MAQTTKQRMMQRFDEAGIAYERIESANGDFLVSAYGGRVFGPFFCDGECVTWTSDVFDNPKTFASFISKRGWNIGGERMLIAPELTYFCSDSRDFCNTLFVPDEMDPGHYALSRSNESCMLSQTLDLTGNLDGVLHHKSCRVERIVRSCADPIAVLGKRVNYVFAGVEQVIFLEDLSTQTPLILEPWLITQVRSGGYAYVPFHAEDGKIDYYEPLGPGLYESMRGVSRMLLDGKNRYKVGFSAACITGRALYVRKRTGATEIIVRNYYNDPSNPYACAPWHCCRQSIRRSLRP